MKERKNIRGKKGEAMRARFNSYCPYCGGAIFKGDLIAKGNKGWGHIDCVNGNTPKEMRRCSECGRLLPADKVHWCAEANGYVCEDCEKALFM